MRIIDKRSDYYDNVSPYDKHGTVWVRQESTITVNFGFMGDITGISGDTNLNHNDIKSLYNIVRDLPDTSHPDKPLCVVSVVSGIPYVVFYKNAYLGRPQDIISSNTPSGFIDKWNKSEHNHMSLSEGRYEWYRNPPFRDKSLVDWYNNHKNNKLYTNIHMDLNSPLYNLSYNRNTSVLTITANPILKSIGAATVLEPWFLYNEIDRYIGNEMANNPLDTFIMSDELKRDSKGMDKWSFKQRGPKKRKQKKTK